VLGMAIKRTNSFAREKKMAVPQPGSESGLAAVARNFPGSEPVAKSSFATRYAGMHAPLLRRGKIRSTEVEDAVEALVMLSDGTTTFTYDPPSAAPRLIVSTPKVIDARNVMRTVHVFDKKTSIIY